MSATSRNTQQQRHVGDALCQTISLAMSFHTCESPVLVDMDKAGIWSTGKPWAAAAFQWDGSTCKQLELDPRWFRFYELGKKLEQAPFASLESKQVGSGRLTTGYLGAEGQPLVATRNPVQVFDSRLNKTCRFVSSPADGIRCLPDEMFLALKQPIYSDSRCSDPVMACDNCEGKEVALSDPAIYDEFPLTDIRSIGQEASGVYYEREFKGGQQVCKGPLDVRDWRGPKQEPIALPHLWKIGAATSWDRFEQVFVREH